MSRRKGVIICIIGIDGSGKSTIAKRIGTETILTGKKFEYVYARFIPMLSRPLVYLAQSVLGKEKSENKNVEMVNRAKKKSFLSKPIVSKTTEMIFFLDYLIQILFKVWIPYSRGEYLICDRYLYDTIISDLGADIGWTGETTLSKIRKYQRLFPRPSVLIWLEVDPEIAIRRKNDVPSIQFLRERAALYGQIANGFDLKGINANMDQNAVFEEVVNLIRNESTKWD